MHMDQNRTFLYIITINILDMNVHLGKTGKEKQTEARNRMRGRGREGRNAKQLNNIFKAPA